MRHPAEIPGFVQVSGRRGDLPTYTGVQRQPDEDLRLVSSLGYINLSGESATRVPLLFNYRGEVIPAFALQAFLTWARIPMSEVQIQIGSHIALPGGRKIPIDWDGSLRVNPNASKLGRRFSLNELLLAGAATATKLPVAKSARRTDSCAHPFESAVPGLMFLLPLLRPCNRIILFAASASSLTAP